MLRLLSFFLFIAGLSSCNKKTVCHNAWGYGLVFYSSTADSIRDSNATVTEYIKGSSFTKPVRTITDITFIAPYLPLSKYTGSKDSLYMYDRIVTLYPSGKIYKMHDFNHIDRSVKSANSEEVDCLNDVSCVLNDSSYFEHDPANNGHWYIYLKIKY